MQDPAQDVPSAPRQPHHAPGLVGDGARRIRGTLRHIALAFAAVALSACGGGGSSGSADPGPPPPPVPVQGTVTFVHVFGLDAADGGQPSGPLLQATDGNFYGTTLAGGTNWCGAFSDAPCGTVFRSTPGGQTTILHDFGASADDGYFPSAPLIQGQDGALYGVTSFGGTWGNGTVFRLTLDGQYTRLHSFGGFPADGVVPVGGLVQATDGNFYGATSSGGAHYCIQIPGTASNCGTIFRMTPAGETSIVYSFGASAADGVEPNGSLIQARDGNLYGTTQTGGSNDCVYGYDCGTVFRMTLAGDATVLHSFGPTYLSPMSPLGPVLEGPDGNFYGTTPSGGGGGLCTWAYGCGAVYRMTPEGTVTTLHGFSIDARTDGDGPAPFLAMGSDGKLYGTTRGGGDPGKMGGTAFRLSLSGTLETFYSFGPTDTDPSDPLGGVIQGRDGAFYGTTAYNGTFGATGARPGEGTLFRLELH